MLWALAVLKRVYGVDGSNAAKMVNTYADTRGGVVRARYERRKEKGATTNEKILEEIQVSQRLYYNYIVYITICASSSHVVGTGCWSTC
jgi:hypothetical protein